MDVCKAQIGTRIRQTLDARGIRPAELAERVGVSRAAVSGWLKGEKLSVAHLGTIAGLLDVSLNWLVLHIGTPDLAGESNLTDREEDLIRLLRYFGDGVAQQAAGMIRALTLQDYQPLKGFKAYDLVSRTGMPIVVIDAKGHLVYSNIYHNQLLGLDEDKAKELHGRHFTDWIPKIFHRTFRSILQDTLRKGYTNYASMHLTCPVTQQHRKIIIHSRAISTESGPGAQLLIRAIDHASFA